MTTPGLMQESPVDAIQLQELDADSSLENTLMEMRSLIQHLYFSLS